MTKQDLIDKANLIATAVTNNDYRDEKINILHRTLEGLLELLNNPIIQKPQE